MALRVWAHRKAGFSFLLITVGKSPEQGATRAPVPPEICPVWPFQGRDRVTVPPGRGSAPYRGFVGKVWRPGAHIRFTGGTRPGLTMP